MNRIENLLRGLAENEAWLETMGVCALGILVRSGFGEISPENLMVVGIVSALMYGKGEADRRAVCGIDRDLKKWEKNVMGVAILMMPPAGAIKWFIDELDVIGKKLGVGDLG